MPNYEKPKTSPEELKEVEEKRLFLMIAKVFLKK